MATFGQQASGDAGRSGSAGVASGGAPTNAGAWSAPGPAGANNGGSLFVGAGASSGNSQGGAVSVGAGGSSGAPASAGHGAASGGESASLAGSGGVAALPFPPLDFLRPPAVFGLDDDVVFAGATQTPEMVGLTTFKEGTRAEAFVMRVTREGERVWSKLLEFAGWPGAIARTKDDLVIAAQYTEDPVFWEHVYSEQKVYLTKIGLDGVTRFERVLPFDHDYTEITAVAVGEAGAIYLVGSYLAQDVMQTSPGVTEIHNDEYPVLIKCDEDGNQLWERAFTQAPGHTATFAGIAVLPGGDLVVTGHFYNTVAFGSGAPALTALSKSGQGSGFLVRFTPNGEVVWSAPFGGDYSARGRSLTALEDGGFLLSGAFTPDHGFTLGGETLPGQPFTELQTLPQDIGVLARLDGDGNALWLTPEAGGFRDQLVTDGKKVFAVSSPMGFLRSYDLATGVLVSPEFFSVGARMEPAYLSRTKSGSIWITGTYQLGVPKFFDSKLSRLSLRIREGHSETIFWLRFEPE